jgi:putative DNA primase/helicase
MTAVSPMLRAARWLRDQRGLSVIPIVPGTKKPATRWTAYQHRRATDDELREWFGNGHAHNLAVVTGAVSGVVVVDDDSPAAKAWADAHLPPSTMATRTAHGTHRFYRHPGVPVRNAVRIDTGDPDVKLDVRGDGGYVLVPPSTHPDGGQYERLGPWPPVEQLPVFDAAWVTPEPMKPEAAREPAPEPSGDGADLRRRAEAYVASVPPAIEGEGGDAHTFRLACKLTRGFGLSDTDAVAVLSTWNARCVPPWTDDELHEKIESARRYGSEPVGGRAAQPRPAPTNPPASAPVIVATTPAPEDRLTEAGAAERFARLHGDDVRFDHRRARWLVWQGHRWAPDTDAAVTRLALDFARTWQREAMDLADRDRREAVFRAALRLERREAVVSMLKFAADLRPIADAGDWDVDPMLLGVPNGVVDLRTGTLRPGRRTDRITMAASVPYDPEATSPQWDRTLRDVLVTDDVIAFLHVAAGYSTTGDTRRDCWFLAHGAGRNGKGTVLHPIRRALGDYAMELPAAIFDRRQGPEYDLAALPGKRFVMCSESGDTIRLNHDRIKQLSGGDPVRAAAKYERSFQFDPTCKLWLSCNRKPNVADDTPAFWARVLTVPFAVSFAGREDRALRPALEHDPAHQAAVLAWLVAGAASYCVSGLDAPAPVTAATASYREDSDPLHAFVTEALDLDPDSQVDASDLYAHYRAWAERQGMTDRDWLKTTGFGRRASERFQKSRDPRTGRVVYLGVSRRSQTA